MVQYESDQNVSLANDLLQSEFMSKQKKPTERTREIISAALHVLEDGGLSGFSMEAVAARTTLSKGGVYRFFGNKYELMVGVLEHIANALQPARKEEALAWQVPLRETLLRLVFSAFREPDALQLRRVHMQLMLELPEHPHLFQAMRERFDQVLVEYRDIALAIIERDGLRTRPDFESTVEVGIRIGQSLFDGLLINGLGGMQTEELEIRMSAFVDLVIRATLEDHNRTR